jgi:hypothetical protein
VFNLQAKDASKLAGNWFQLLMVLFMKEYLPTYYLGLQVKCPIYLPHFNYIWDFSTNSHEVPVSKFAKIRPMAAALKHADGRTDGHKEGKGAFRD